MIGELIGAAVAFLLFSFGAAIKAAQHCAHLKRGRRR